MTLSAIWKSSLPHQKLTGLEPTPCKMRSSMPHIYKINLSEELTVKSFKQAAVPSKWEFMQQPFSANLSFLEKI